MALVAYDYSDSSDIEDDENNTSTTVVTTKPVAGISENVINASESTDSSANLFNLLPQPSQNKQGVIEDDDEFLHKKDNLNTSKPKAKISVPSLSDFKDVEGSNTNAKPKISNGKKSGLLSILPQPKNGVSFATTTKSFVPHVLTKPTTTVKKKGPITSVTKKVVHDTKAKDSDDSDDEGEQTDFFSINKPNDILIEDIPLYNDSTPKTIVTNVDVIVPSNSISNHNLQSYFKKDVQEDEVVNDDIVGPSAYNGPNDTHYQMEYGEQSGTSNETVLDDEAILKLCGTRGKRKREEIQIVDVNQTEVLADAREWLLKGLMDDTTKRVSSSKRRGDEPTHQQRRKHQITYLAHQAKANEAELQNQWANNRMSKRQTQSKYGF